MTSDQITAEQARDGEGFLHGRGWGFCQSVITRGPDVGSFGWDGGFGTSWLVDPTRRLTTIVLSQRLFTDPSLPPVHVELQAAARAALA